MILAVVLVISGVIALSHIAPFPMLLDAAAGRGTTIWGKGDTSGQKTVYLTFDDGPNPTATPQLLDMLRERQVKATFFIIDEYVTEETAPIVRRIVDEGHSLGQHTGNRWLLLRPPSNFAEALRSAADRVERLSGKRPCRLFRPHAGWRSLAMMRGARKAGYKIVGWSWRNWDFVNFRKRTGPRVADQIVAHAKPGNIAVIHDGYHKNPRAERQYAIEAASTIIDRLSAEGYQFGTLCEAVDSSR